MRKEIIDLLKEMSEDELYETCIEWSDNYEGVWVSVTDYVYGETTHIDIHTPDDLHTVIRHFRSADDTKRWEDRLIQKKKERKI